MLGWNILEVNLTTGGLLGYSSLNFRVRQKIPSSKGVSTEPIITAVQEKMLSSSGDALMPSGGFFRQRNHVYYKDYQSVSN